MAFADSPPDHEEQLIWFTLMRYYRHLGRGFGLTLPFLIGGSATSPLAQCALVTSPKDPIMSLLTSMRDETPPDFYVSISKCDRLKQPIVSLESSDYLPTSGFVPFVSGQRADVGLFVQSVLLEKGGPDLVSLRRSLLPYVETALAEGKHSFRNQKYEHLNAADFQFIAEAKAWGTQNPIY